MNIWLKFKATVLIKKSEEIVCSTEDISEIEINENVYDFKINKDRIYWNKYLDKKLYFGLKYKLCETEIISIDLYFQNYCKNFSEMYLNENWKCIAMLDYTNNDYNYYAYLSCFPNIAEVEELISHHRKKSRLSFIEIAEQDIKSRQIVLIDNAACTIAHEIIGHILELDNYYYFYRNTNILDIFKSKNLNVLDDPGGLKGLFVQHFNNENNMNYKTIIFDENSDFTGELIGGSINQVSNFRNLRTASFKNKPLIRMTMLEVNSKEKIKQYDKDTIFIDNIKKAEINHKEENIYLFNLTGYLCENYFIKRINIDIMNFNIFNFMKRLLPVNYKNNEIHQNVINCYKKGQVISCGVRSCSWLLNHET